MALQITPAVVAAFNVVFPLDGTRRRHGPKPHAVKNTQTREMERRRKQAAAIEFRKNLERRPNGMTRKDSIRLIDDFRLAYPHNFVA